MLNKTFFGEIEASTADARQRLEASPAIQRCLNGQVEMETYKAFLTEAYHHVKHTVPLLMACGSRLPERLEWLREAIVKSIAQIHSAQVELGESDLGGLAIKIRFDLENF
jgi:hypothetical protein